MVARKDDVGATGVPILSLADLEDVLKDVIYGGMLTPPEIAKAAIEEDVDVLGIYVGGRIGPINDLLQILRKEESNHW